MKLKPNHHRAGTRIAVFAFAAAALLAACASAATSAPQAPLDGAGGATIAPAAAAPATLGTDGYTLGSKGAAELPAASSAPARTSNDVTTTGPLIIRTGTVSLQVADIDAALGKAHDLVVAAGGYVASGQRTGDGERSTASITYRIPAAKFDDALAALQGIGQKLLAEQIASDEVTSQVVDLAARVSNLRTTEAALQKIMDQATKIPDVLAVQDQLSATRDEIERLVAQQQNLQDQAALATLTVTFSLPPAVAVTTVSQGWNPGGVVDRAVATMVGLGQGVAEAVIWFGIVILPIALVIGIPSLILLALVRRRRRNHPKATGPAAPGSTPSALWPAG